MRNLWDSKKFKAALIAAGVALVASYFGLSQEAVWSAIAPFMVYVGGQAVVDAKLALKAPPKK